jgi:hypothetical protein
MLAACGAPAPSTFEQTRQAVSPYGTIQVKNKQIDRLGPVPVAPPDQGALDAFMGGFTANPITDFRTQAAADAAVNLAILGSNGQPVRLGDWAIVRPGLGNIFFSPAQVFLLARHFDTVIVLYSNMTDPVGPTALRQVSSLEGVNIPASVAGSVRIFALGSPQLNIISFEQQSDVTLEQLEILRQNQAMLGFNIFNERGHFFAHSQGVNDGVITDERLREAGLDRLGRVVGVAGAVLGGRLIGTAVGDSFVAGAEAVAGEQGRYAFELLTPTLTMDALANHLNLEPTDPERRMQRLLNRLENRTYAAFGGVVDPNAPQGNVRAAFFGLAQLPDFYGQVAPNDGVENLDSTTLGRHSLTFQQTDHILITEDPNILRAELQVLVDNR